MPTYEYECQNCGHRFEKFQSMSDPLLKTCPECKAKKLKRLIGTGAGLLFKGEGFYITDYRSKGYQEKAKSDKAPEGGTPSGGSGESGGSGSGTTGAGAPGGEAKKAAAPKKKRPTSSKN